MAYGSNPASGLHGPATETGVKLEGASGKVHGAPSLPWAMPAPTEVSKSSDGHPSGRHMIDGFRMMAAAARVSGGKHQKEMAEVYDMAALCIENEAKRADRAERLLAAMGSNWTAQEDAAPLPVQVEGGGDE
jgi:hypothetical protein